jgi:hypothetical protein
MIGGKMMALANRLGMVKSGESCESGEHRSGGGEMAPQASVRRSKAPLLRGLANRLM